MLVFTGLSCAADAQLRWAVLSVGADRGCAGAGAAWGPRRPACPPTPCGQCLAAARGCSVRPQINWSIPLQAAIYRGESRSAETTEPGGF